MKGLQDVVNQAKALVQRLREKETAVDATLKDVNTLTEQLTAMRQFREDAVIQVAIGKLPTVNRPGDNSSDGENHNKDQPSAQPNNQKPKLQKHADSFILAHQPIVLALLSENRRLAALEAENAELVKCLEEYQSAMDMIMHKYRSHVTKFAAANQILTKTISEYGQKAQAERTETELRLLNRINDMAHVMQRANAMEDNYHSDVVALVSRLYHENKCLRELLDSRVMGASSNIAGSSSSSKVTTQQAQDKNVPSPSAITNQQHLPLSSNQQPTVSQLLLNGIIPQASSSSNFQPVIYQNRTNPEHSSSAPSSSSSSSVVLQTPVNGLPYRVTTGASPSSSYVASANQSDPFKLVRRSNPGSIATTANSAEIRTFEDVIKHEILANNNHAAEDDDDEDQVEDDDNEEDDESNVDNEVASNVSPAPSLATLCPDAGEEEHDDQQQQEIDDLVAEMMSLDSTTTVDVTMVEPASS